MRKSISTAVLASGLALGVIAGPALDVTTAPPAQAATEYVRNVCCDGTDYSFTVVLDTGYTQTLTPGQSWSGQVKTVRAFSWECFRITDMSGRHVYTTPRGCSSISVPDGSGWNVNPFKASSSGYCY